MATNPRCGSLMLLTVALVQCWATRTNSGCQALSLHDSKAACDKQARENSQFDKRALRATGLPAVTSYHCEMFKD